MSKGKFNYSSKQRFGIRKLSVGVASCLIGFSMVVNERVAADETTVVTTPDTTSVQTTESANSQTTTIDENTVEKNETTVVSQPVTETEATPTPELTTGQVQAETPATESDSTEVAPQVAAASISDASKPQIMRAVLTASSDAISAQAIRTNGDAADDFSAYKNEMQNLKFQIKNTGTAPINNVYATLEVPLADLKAPSTTLYTQFWASSVPYTEVDGDNGQTIRHYKVELGTIAAGKMIELPFNIQSNYEAPDNFITPLKFNVYGEDGTSKAALTASTDVDVLWETKDLAPTSIALTGSTLGYKNDDPNEPYIGEWGVIDQAYIDQAKKILEAGARKVIPYVPTRSGMVLLPEFAAERGVKNAADYTIDFIMSEIDTLHKMFGDTMGGIFLDEFTNGYSQYAKTVDWSKELVNRIREKYGKDFVIIGNPGGVVTDAVLEADLDEIITFEGTADRYLSTANLHPNGIAKEDPSRLWHIVYNITKDNIDAVLAKADAENINHLYLTDGTIIRNVRNDGTVAQSPFATLPSDWVVEAMKKWQDRKKPSTSEGTTIDPMSRYISPISYWYPDSIDPMQRNHFEQILTLQQRLGYLMLSSNNNTWNIRTASTLKYTMSWPNTYNGVGAPSNNGFLYRIKVPDHVDVLNSAERTWEDGLDGYYYSPAVVGPSQNLYVVNKSTSKDERPWTVELDIVDAKTKKVVATQTASSVTHNVHYKEFGRLEKEIITDTGKVLEPKSIVYVELLAGSVYSTDHAVDFVDEDGKTWVYKGLADDSAPESGTVQVGNQLIRLVYSPKSGGRVVVKYVDENDKEIIPTKTIVESGTQVGSTFEYDTPIEITDASGLVYTLAVGDPKSVGRVNDTETVLTYIYLKKTGGSVTAMYVNDKGEAIIPKSPVKVNAQVGTPYTTTHEQELVDADGKVWVYDKLAANSAPIEGTVAVTDDEVVYQYVPKLGGQVVVKYVDENGKEILTDNIIQPKLTQVGTQYSAPKESEITDANGLVYVLKEAAQNETGRVATEDTTVTFIYTAKLGGNVSAHYQTINGATLLPTQVIALNAPVGSTYTSNYPQTITDNDGRIWIYSTLDTGSAPSSGMVKSVTQIITYLYEPMLGGQVVARFVDTNGNEILPEQIIWPKDTQVGTAYLTVKSPELLSNNGKTYSLKEIPTNTEGRVSESETVLTFVYSENLNGNVSVRYVNSLDGQAILPSEIIKLDAPIGESYTTTHPDEVVDENGFVWIYKGLGGGSAAANGTVKEGSQLVTHVYDPKPGKGVTSRYLDDNGQELRPSIKLLADNTQQGTPYETTKTVEILANDGKVYVLKAIEGNEIGKVSAEPVTVTYVYTAKTGGTVTVSYITDAGVAIKPTEVVLLNAQIGSRYTTVRPNELTDADGKVWIYDRLGDGSADATGAVTSTTKNVIYVYSMKPGKEVVSDYLFDGRGELPTQIVKPSGTQVGVQYQASKPLEVTLSDGLVYVLQEVPNNEDGRVADDPTQVTYRYIPKKGGLVTAIYVTTDGVILAPNSIVASDKQVGADYSTEHPAEITDAKGRVWVYSALADGSAKPSGKVADRAQDVIYVYVPKPGGNVISRFVTPDGMPIIADKITVSGQQIGSDYAVTPLQEVVDADGKVWVYAQLAEQSAPATDKVATSDTLVVFQYLPKPGGNVISRFVTPDGMPIIADKITVSGQQIGSDYAVTPLQEVVDADGKVWVYAQLAEQSAPATDKVATSDTLVVFQYLPKLGGKVIVKYIDEQGNMLLPDREIIAAGQQIGSKFTLNDEPELIINGKTYKLSASQSSGIIGEEDTVITYTLQLVEEKPQKEKEEPHKETPKAIKAPAPMLKKAPAPKPAPPIVRREVQATLPKTGSADNNVLTLLGMASLTSLFYAGKHRKKRSTTRR